MRISCAYNFDISSNRPKGFTTNIKSSNACKRYGVNYIKNVNSNIAFGNRPWTLDPLDFGVHRYGELSASDGIRLYDQLRTGNYLDIGNDSFEYSICNDIRERNLSFLDRISAPKEKSQFIEHYKNVTGFPDLGNVSRKIKYEFLKAVNQSSANLSSPEYNVLLAGYDGVCSVGRGKAFPGSDLDKAYVIIRGDEDLYDENILVNKFKGELWRNTDQRILSYNHDEAAFPQVYTKNQLEKLVSAIDEKDIPYRRLRTNHISASDVYISQDYIIGGISRVTPQYMDDYVKANPYWVKYCREFPIWGDDIVRPNYPSRENIKNVGFVLEAIREGEVLRGNKNDLSITGRHSYSAANLSQLAALKIRPDKKAKRLVRDNIKQEFSGWDLDKQFRFIKTLIKSACANNKLFTTEFSKYFSKPGQDMFAGLIKALMRW